MIIHFLNINNFIEKDIIAQKGIKSWQKYMPEHQIKLWTEDDEFIKNILSDKNNRIINQCQKNNIYTYEYLRLKILYEFGGAFCESDVILLEHFDIDENDEYFYSLTFKEERFKSFGIEGVPIIAKPKNVLIGALIDFLENNFIYNGKLYREAIFCNANLIKDFPNFKNEVLTLEKKTFDFKRKNGDLKNKMVHLFDWFLYTKDICYFSRKDIYKNIEDIKKIKHLMYIGTGNSKYSKVFNAYFKYQLYNNPSLKDRVLDPENLLGDLDEISPKDWEILDRI